MSRSHYFSQVACLNRFSHMGAVAELYENRESLHAFRQGERETLHEVYSSTVKDVYLVLRRGFRLTSTRVPGLSDPVLLEEMAQEVYARAFAPQARANYSGTVPYRAYLLQIVRNLMVDRARKRSPEQCINSEDPEALEILHARSLRDEQQPAWELSLDETRRAECVQGFVQGLRASERALYELRYREGLSERDVAGQLKISRRKVRHGADRLRRGLRNHLKEQGLWP